MDDGVRDRLAAAAAEDQEDSKKPASRAGRKFLSLMPEAQAALAALGKQYGCTPDIMQAFLRAALDGQTVTSLVHDHLASGGKGGGE